jgi:Domain of unknown function (DUF4388)/FHA domain
MEKVLEGNLARFEAPDLLNFLNMCRRTGVLVMERPDQETKLFLRDGRPVFATSTKEELRLGAIVVRLGKVPAEVLAPALSRHGAVGHRLGQVLIAEKLLTEAELASCLKVQVSEVIFDTFRWGQGLFTFWDGVPPPASAVTLEMDLQNLLMEGARRIDERGRLAEVFPDLGMAVETVANPERVKHSVNMTPEEWKVFFLVDGRRTLSEICHLAGNADDALTLQILHNLVLAKFVTVVPAPSPASSATLPPPVEVEGQGHGTQKMGEDKAPAAGSVSVEFSEGQGPKPEDDTKEIVTPKAVQYRSARKLTTSRLVLVKDGAETAYPLTRDTYTVGRHRNNDIVVSDPKVSSFHARFDRTQEGFVLVDLRSRNGSFVNGKRVEALVLQTGDEVRLGTARLRYKMD